ncbi:MAG: ROK family protein [Verrucomicrobia bacterium]|nr:ROK family protein [Verrucomicrobiota bacterium]
MAESGGKQEYYIGVDLGGTKILAGVFSHNLKCAGRAKVSTKAQRGPEAVIERIARCVRDAVDECDLDLKKVKGVGVGAPGPVDPENGHVIVAPNLGWEDAPLKKELEKLLDTPVFVENDCNVCTLGVYECELQSKPKDVVGIFIGTGIGAGLILNGKPYSGFNRSAGEIGHMVVEVGGPKCSCGNRGCFEAVASRQAIFRKIQAAVKDGQKTILTDILGDDILDMRSGDLRKALRKGDKFLEKLIEEAAEYIGIGVANVINLLNPEVVVLGGGIIYALEDDMMAIIVETAKDYALSGTAKGIEIIASKLGDDAGIVGGAVLARRETK